MADKTYEACGSGMSLLFWKSTVAYLQNEGLLNDECQTTALGNAYVTMLATTPFPVQKFVDPRFDP